MALKKTKYSFNAGVDSPVRFLFVSDLHDCENEPLIDAIEAARPDAVLVGGDFIHNSIKCEKGLNFLRASAWLAPTFCSIGNHDRHLGAKLAKAVGETGAVLLDDSFVSFRGITIGGLSSGYGDCSKRQEITPPPETEWLDGFCRESGYRLLLCHHPEYYDSIVKPLPIDLTVSGHAHGGQWRFFGRGVFAPGQGIFPKYTAGLYDGGRLLVGRGLGNPYPIPRIFNPPEIIVITLE